MNVVGRLALAAGLLAVLAGATCDAGEPVVAPESPTPVPVVAPVAAETVAAVVPRPTARPEPSPPPAPTATPART